MPSRSHQTIRLERGRHTEPDEGACVMELASMLAGERFSDHPECACPVVGAFLRSYNDLVGDEHRQTLYRYAAAVVGSRAGADVERARFAACAAWSAELISEHDRSWWRRWRLRQAACRYPTEDGVSATARLGARLARQDGDAGHARVLAFVDSLLAIGRDERVPVVAGPQEPVAAG